MNTLEKVLVQLLYFNGLDRKSLLLALKDVTEPNVYHSITQGLKKEYIIEKKTFFYRDTRRYNLSFLSLTSQGIMYLLNNDEVCDQFPWINDIEIPEGRLSVLGRRGTSSNGREVLKYIQNATAAVMMQTIGAKVNPMYFDFSDFEGLMRFNRSTGKLGLTLSDYEKIEADNAENKEYDLSINVNRTYRLSQYVMNSYLLHQTALKCESDDISEKESQSMKFLNSTEVRNIFLENVYGKETRAQEMTSKIVQARTGQMSGLLDTGDHVMIIFSEPPFGMSWTGSSPTSPDLVMYRDYLRHVRPDITSRSIAGEVKGVLLVRNHEEFQRNFYDIYKRRNVNDPFSLGDGFNNLYMIPVDRNGIDQLQKVIYVNDKEEEKGIIEWGLGNSFDRPDGSNISLRCFSLHDPEDDSYIFYGVLMDIVKMNALAKTIQKYPNLKVKIFCLTWQESYYRKLFPNAETIPPSIE